MTTFPAMTGVILAGGQSSRMGQNKALLPFGSQRLIDRVVEVMGSVFQELLMVTNSPEVYDDLRIPMVGDVFPGKGSLGGIYSALYHSPTPCCLVVACDMPFLQPAVLRYMAEQLADYDVVIPDILGEMQPLHAIYRQTCLAPMLRRLEAQRLKITGFFPEVQVRVLEARELQPFDPEFLVFQNLNTPEELHSARQRLAL